MNQFPLIGLGLATTNNAGETLDTYFPKIAFKNAVDEDRDLFEVWSGLLDQDVCEITDLSTLQLSEKSFLSSLGKPNENSKLILCRISEDHSLQSVEEAYLKLHLLSYKFFQPNTLNLENMFNILPNVAWTNRGPIDLNEIDQKILESKAQNISLEIKSIDKFPRLVDYIVPAGVRIADTSRVRLGAYLSEGTTVMHEGFVNFNAGTLGKSMVEGRISAGVVVGDGSDIGGGASIMGTLSGGGKEVISIGQRTLLGANSGIGISLGDDCVVEAGIYITAGSKITLPDGKIVKAKELSGANNLLFRRNSQSGSLEALPKTGNWSGLNSALHKN